VNVKIELHLKMKNNAGKKTHRCMWQVTDRDLGGKMFD